MINTDLKAHRNNIVHRARNYPFLISLFLLAAISINFIMPAYALDVNPGDTITFEIINSIGSIGVLENVTTSMQQPSFITLTDNLNNEPFSLSPGASKDITFTVGNVNNTCDSSLTVDVKPSMKTQGLMCNPPEWNETVYIRVLGPNDQYGSPIYPGNAGDPDSSGYPGYPGHPVNQNPGHALNFPILAPPIRPIDPETDNPEIDNTDPTYIQPYRREELQYQYGTYDFFSPLSSPELQDIYVINYTIKYSSQINIQIFTNNAVLVRNLIINEIRSPGNYSVIWDGRDDSGELLQEGVYTYIINGINIGNIADYWTLSGEVIIDNTPPIAYIELIQKDVPVYGYHTFIGTASDSNLNAYYLDIYKDSSDILINYSNISVTESKLGVFYTAGLDEGIYFVRLTAIDFAGNSSVSERVLVIRRLTSNLNIQLNYFLKDVDMGSEGYLATSDDPDVWIEDEMPLGGTAIGTWEWDSMMPYSGSHSHTNPLVQKIGRHYFIHADEPLLLASNENIIQYVYLDPYHPPAEILMQFYTDTGDGEHRAYWGGNFVPTGGKNGTASLYRMGDLPPLAKWVRLKIPAPTLGLSGKEIKGVAFVTYDGRAWWDKTTKSSYYNEAQQKSLILASQIGSDNSVATTIQYTTSLDANIRVDIYDESNTLVKTLVNGFQEAGNHSILWDGIDDNGILLSDGRYYFQFKNIDGYLETNVYGFMPGDWASKTVIPKTAVVDSRGDTYEIDAENSSVNKYDVYGRLLFSITAETLLQEAFSPVAIDLDDNDNLFIVDRVNSKIFKLDLCGYYLIEIPYPEYIYWADHSISLNHPVALKVDEYGDIFIANNDGEEIIKLTAGRGIIDIVNITAEIRVPYEHSLVYAYIPITGTASARNFLKYIVDYGYGENPGSWTTIATGYNEVFDDFNPLPGSRTIYGNLATFLVTPHPDQRTGGLPMGIYTIRLRVYNKVGQYRATKVRVCVARVVGWDGGVVPSDDGLVTFHIPPGAIADDQELFSIQPIDPSLAPPVKNLWIIPVGKVYEFRPAGYKFVKSCTLKMYYTGSQFFGLQESTLKIYRWNPLIQQWIYVPAELDTAHNVLTTTLTEFNGYQVYYAIMSDPPPPPVIYQPPSPTILKTITVSGKASQSVSVEVSVNNIPQGVAQADVNTGGFVMSGVLLEEGDNILTARAIDSQGNNSDPSKPVHVRVVVTRPIEVSSLAFKTMDFSGDFEGNVAIGERLFIELIGIDGSPETVDSATVTLGSSITDPVGISVQLLETARDSGIYRGMAMVSEKSDASAQSIGVSAAMTEMITVYADMDPAKNDSVMTEDRIPPPAPVISSATHPSLCQDTFEVDLGQWSNMSNIYGAVVARSSEERATGIYSAKLVNAEEGGDFANYVRFEAFDASLYPVVSFDYKIPEGVKINLIAYVNGMWKEIVFTDDPKRVETFDEDLYRTIGVIQGIVSDNTWRHAGFNLYNMLKNDDPSQEAYIVEELFFADYNLLGWMELNMGGENAAGSAWFADNFIISSGGQSNADPTFTWEPGDASVVAYSYALDVYQDTIPDQEIEGPENTAAFHGVGDGIWYFHVRSVDGGGNWGPANHYRIMVDTTGPVADMPEPADGSSSGSLEVKVRITDGQGSGVNTDTIQFKINDVTYDMASGGLSYDEATGILTFSLWKVFPVQDPWLDGEIIQASVIAAADFAGNPVQGYFSWSWTVDYTMLTGGYLSLLTTQGGFTPSWSYDGTRIAFMSERGGNQDIWIIEADDYAEQRGTAIQLTFDGADDHHPAWSPVSDQIAFVSDRAEGVDHIYLINADGTGLVQLTFGDEADSHPSWSPDGASIAFSRGAEIWAVDADGGNERQITFDSIEYYLEPAWSFDGSEIAFTKSLYVDEVAVIDSDGENDRVLTGSNADFLPAWSGSTGQILFVTGRDEKTNSIRIIDSIGGNESQYIDNAGTWWDSEPAVSPIGENVAFQSTRNGTWNIWVKNELAVIDVAVSPDTISPNSDGVKDTADIAFTLMGGNAYVDLRIHDLAGNPMATLLENKLMPEGVNVATWDGSGNSGAIVLDGAYFFTLSIQGSAGAKAIERSGMLRVDTTPPAFTDWVIPGYTSSGDSQTVSVMVTDNTSVNLNTIKLQYGIARGRDLSAPDIVGWTDIGIGASATLDLKWFNYVDDYLYIRAYAEDMHGNEGYSAIQQRSLGNTPPFAKGQSIIMDEDTTLPIELKGSDINGDPLTFKVLTSPSHGTLSGKAPNLTYSPEENYFGTDSFSFSVNDGIADSATASVNIRVESVNDPPVVVAAPYRTVSRGERVALEIAESSDIDGTIVKWQWYQINGPEVVLSNSQTGVATFKAPITLIDDLCLTFRVVVTDDGGLEAQDETIVIVRSYAVTITPEYSDVYGNVLLNNYSIGQGKFIAVFVPGAISNNVCIGLNEITETGQYAITIYADNPNTEDKDGALPGDVLTFKFIDTNRGIITDLCPIGPDEAKWNTQNEMLNINLTIAQKIPLAQGWNLISFQVAKCFYEHETPALSIMDANSLLKIEFEKKDGLKSWLLDDSNSLIRDDVDFNKAGDWQRIISFDEKGANILDKALPDSVNTLHYLSCGYGYWIKMNKPGFLFLDGKLTSPDITLNLKTGWNLAGYIPVDICYAEPNNPPENICPYITGVYESVENIVLCHVYPFPDAVFPSVKGKYRRIISFDACKGGMLYDIMLPEFINTLDYVGPKYGFWIKMYEDAGLVFPNGCPKERR